jgi:hypothetical protein
MINNVAHHLTPAQNVELAQRVVRALAPSGIYSAGEFLRSEQVAPWRRPWICISH